MCGKGSQGGGGQGALGWGGLAPAQQQTIQASPEAMGWYRNAMNLAQQAVGQPYRQFGTTASDFVAQLNAQQQAAQQGLQGLAGSTQEGAQAGAGMIQGAGQANAAQMAADQYMNPYMSQVVDPVRAAMEQQQGQQLSQQQTEAIKGGAFGGERAGLQRAMLRGQQNLATGQALSPLYQQGWGQALGAAQTDLSRRMQAGQGLIGAGLATQQASLGAGTLGQQTEQAGIDALRQQFQQQQMWPYMQAQFLSGIAGGLGPLMGQQTYQAHAMSPFGSFLGFAEGGAVDDEAARMGGAVIDLEPGVDYYRGGVVPRGYATRGAVSYGGGDVGDILKSQEAMYHRGEDDYGKLPTGQVQAAKGLEAPNLTSEQQKKAGLKDITGAAKDILGIGKDIYGMFSGKSSQDETGGMGAASSEDSGSSTLGTLGKLGLSAAANYFLPGSGALTSLLPFAEGGSVPREHYYEGGDIFERGVIGAESAGHQFDRSGRTLTSPKGALGIAQIMPGTAPEAAKLAGLEYSPERLRTDEAYNKALGRAYYNEQLRKFGTPELAAAAYNAGPGAVQKALNRAGATGRDVMSFLPAETRAYVPKVLGHGIAAPGGGLDQARSELMSSRRDIPPGDPRRSFVAKDLSEERKDEGGLSGLMKAENVVPALMGLGKGLSAMMSAKTVSPGAALAAGLGEGLAGGAESYLGTQKLLAEIPKIQAETKERENLAERQEAETAAVRAGLYEKQFITGRGLFIFDKTDPYKGLIQITDASGNPVPGKEHIARELQGGGGAGGAPGAPPPTAAALTAESGIPRGGKAFEWTPRTAAPQNYTPPNQFQMMLPENAARNQTQGLEMVNQYQNDAKRANSQLLRIGEMEHAVRGLNEGNEEFLKTGAWGTARLGIAKNLNKLVEALGGSPPFDPRTVSDAEILAKDAFRLGSEAGSALGSNEAGHIITASVGATPGLESTKEGYVRLLSGMKMAAQYQQDKAKFIDDYYNRFGHTSGAPQLFDQMNPTDNYVRRAVAATVDQQALKDLKRFGPDAMRQFIDSRYGNGTTNVLMGIGE